MSKKAKAKAKAKAPVVVCLSVKALSEAKGFKVPKGEAIVIDPCYVLGEDPFWHQFCDMLFDKEKPAGTLDTKAGVVVHLSVDGDEFDIFTCNTNCGDGQYPVYQDGVEEGAAAVDAGLLCIIPKPLFDSLAKFHDSPGKELGVWVDCNGGRVFADGEGNWEVANVKVVTDGSDEEEDEEYDDGYGDDDFNDDEEDA